MRYTLIPDNPYWDDDINDYIELILAQNNIVRQKDKKFLLAISDRAIAYIPPLTIDYDVPDLLEWKKFCQTALSEVRGSDSPHKTILCPGMIARDHWIAIIITVSTVTTIAIYDPTSSDSIVATQYSAYLTNLIGEPSESITITAIHPRKQYKPVDSGIVVAEYVAQFIINPHLSDIDEDTMVLKTKQVVAIEQAHLHDGEKHYGITNFLARNTTYTRSIVLNKFLERCEPLNLDYSDTAFIFIQHIIPQTRELIKALITHCKTTPNNIFLLGKLYSTESWTLNQLRSFGINLVETNPTDYAGYPEFSEIFLADLLRLLTRFQTQICIEGTTIKKVVILDDGGRCITQFMLDSPDGVAVAPALAIPPIANQLKSIGKELLRFFHEKNIYIAAVEQTSAGCDLETEGLIGGSGKLLPFPVVMMASSITKKMLESVLISGQLWEKLQNEIFKESPSSDIRIGIIGYGKIGKAIAQKIIAAQKTNPQIQLSVYDINETIRSANITFCESLEKLIHGARYIIGCTGRNTLEHCQLRIVIGQIREDKTFISCSSENKEFFALIQRLKQSQLITSSDVNPLSTIQAKINGYEIKILYGGCPFNFSGPAPGVYFQDIQSTLCLLFGGILQAHYLAGENHSIDLICEHRGLSRLAIYDPFIQQTIIKLSIENIESLQKIFDPHQSRKTIAAEQAKKPENLKFLREILQRLVAEPIATEFTISTLSCYEYTQSGVNAEDSQGVALGAEQQTTINHQFAISNFRDLCREWLDILQRKYFLSSTIEIIVQQLVPTTALVERDDTTIALLPQPDRNDQTHCPYWVVEIQIPPESGPCFFSKPQRAPGSRVIRISLPQLFATTDIASDIPNLCTVIADPKHLNPEKFLFWTTAATTIRSLAELAPFVDTIIKSFKSTFSTDTLIFIIEISIRLCSFYYRMGCIYPALTFITYAELLIKRILPNLTAADIDLHSVDSSASLTDQQQKQLQEFKHAIDEVHWLNIYFLKYEYDRYDIKLKNSVTEIINQKIDSAQKIKMLSQLLNSSATNSWAVHEQLAALYNTRNEFSESVKHYRRAIAQISDNISQLEKTSEPKNKAKAGAYRYYRANMQLELGELYLECERDWKNEAMLLFYRSMDCYKNILKKEISLDEALNLWKLGKFYFRLEQITKAMDYLQSSLAMLKVLGLDKINSLFIKQIQKDIVEVHQAYATTLDHTRTFSP